MGSLPNVGMKCRWCQL